MDGNKRNNSDDVTKRKTASIRCVSESPLFDDVNATYKSLKAETIEVVPEIIPYDDSEYEQDNDDDDDDDDDDEYIDFDEDDNNGIDKTTKSMTNFYDYNDNEQEDFDEYGYQVKWNGQSEPILFDNSEIRKMDMTDDDDYDEDDVDEAGNVILIESEDDYSGESGSLMASGSLNADGSTSDAGDRKMYECDICFRKVASSYNLKRHMMIHTGEKPYGCDICNRRFREFSDLKKHRRVHSTEKQFKCMTCHRNPPSATNATKCAICESTEAAQKSQELAMDHIIPRYDGNKKAFVCNYCDRVFGSSSNLKRHIMIHTGEKPFTCNVCQRSFREMSTLKKHSFTHRNHLVALAAVMPTVRAPSPPLKCYVCPKSFTDANLFKQHVLSHSDAQHDLPEITMKPVMVQRRNSKTYHHKCPKCSEIFYDSSKLMLHICSVHKVNGTTTTTTAAAATTTTAVAAAAATTTLTHTVSKAVTPLRKPTSSPPPLIPINRTAFAARMHHMSVGDAIQQNIMAQYFCRICSKKFRSQQHLLSHQLTHKK